LEVGTEEIPARMLRRAAEDLLALVLQALREQGLSHAGGMPLCTPRRLAVLVLGVPEHQPDREQVALGPPVQAAYDAQGTPTRAAIGFARAQGVPVEALERAQGPRGEVVAVRRCIRGRDTREVLAETLPDVLARLTFPKTMHWDGHRGPFVRPIHWIACLFGPDPVCFDFAGVVSGRASRGHRFLAPDPFDLGHPDAYVSELERRFVLVRPDQRRERIEQAMRDAEAASGLRFVVQPELLEEVSNLVEWPVFGVGSFDAAFLSLPPEVLVTAMASHQRYFAMSGPDGRLAAQFGVVMNTLARDPSAVIRGNQRVLAARLFDARFFYEQDLKTGIRAMSDRLRERVFLKGAGDMAEKSSRIAEIAVLLAESAAASDEVRHLVLRAAALCKADLMSQMVAEFPELQGVMGRYYAKAAGESEVVADAILDHYRPRHAGDSLPETEVGAFLAAADRADSIVTCFDAGVVPSGSRDPLGLRRQATGLLKILIARDWPGVTVGGLLVRCRDPETARRAAAFVRERFHSLLTDEYEVPTDFATAVLAGYESKPPADVLAIAVALRDFARQTEGFRDFLETVFKRVFNILRQADEKLPGWRDRMRAVADSAVFDAAGPGAAHPFEVEVERTRVAAEQVLRQAREDRDYRQVLEALYSFKAPLAAFFGTGSEGVPVLIEKDPRKRDRRLALLARVLALFEWFADFTVVSSR